MDSDQTGSVDALAITGGLSQQPRAALAFELEAKTAGDRTRRAGGNSLATSISR